MVKDPITGTNAPIGIHESQANERKDSLVMMMMMMIMRDELFAATAQCLVHRPCLRAVPNLFERPR